MVVREFSSFKDILKMDPSRVVGVVFTTLGSIFLLVVMGLYWADQKTTRSSSKITGTVISLDYNNSGSSIPVIEYRHNGKKKILRGSVWSYPPSFEVDEKVELLVNNNDPNKVTMDSFIERYFLISLFGFFAVVFGGIGYALLIFMKK